MSQIKIVLPTIYIDISLIDNRRSEFKQQPWNLAVAQELADKEGILLTDEHWTVLLYLRNHYLENGLPQFSRYLVYALSKKFATQGGTKYLRSLFPGGPITQGSRIANIPAPRDTSTDLHNWNH